MDYLNRKLAPFPDALWERIDKTAMAAARDLLTGRRYLDLEGPYGAGLTSVEVGADFYCRQPAQDEAGAVASRAVSVPMIRKSCSLSVRQVEAALKMGQPLGLREIENAAEAVGRREEQFVYYGEEKFGIEGLLSARQRSEVRCGDWSKVEQALNDVLGAVNQLEAAGFRGPYALAVAPNLYNDLFRRYEGTDMLQLEHLKRLCELGVFKAPIAGAVLVDGRLGRLILAQDLMVGYAGNDGIHYQLFVSESIVLVVQEPKAICTLAAG